MALERLQKYLARAGSASRRACEELIRQGRVRVDGAIVREMGVKIDPESAVVLLDEERVKLPELVYFIAFKPKGTVSTSSDPHGRPTVIDLLPENARARVFVVGRLDRDSTGLVLLTNNGELAQRMTHPRYRVVKRYHVRVKGVPDDKMLEKLKKGVWLAEGKTCSIVPHIIAREAGTTLLEIDLSEGTNRVLRRSLAKVGLKVRRLTRVAMGPLELGELRPGECRPLVPEEVSKLLGILSGENLSPPAGSGRKAQKIAAREAARSRAARARAQGLRPRGKPRGTKGRGPQARSARGRPAKGRPPPRRGAGRPGTTRPGRPPARAKGTRRPGSKKR